MHEQIIHLAGIKNNYFLTFIDSHQKRNFHYFSVGSLPHKQKSNLKVTQTAGVQCAQCKFGR